MAKLMKMPPHPPMGLMRGPQGLQPQREQFPGTRSPMELWVGYVNHVPLVGTSANMVDGFIALLLGDRKTAEAKGYKRFLELAGIRDLKPGSILQNHGSKTVNGCSAEVSKSINDYIIQAVHKQGSKGTVKATKAVQAGADLCRNLTVSFDALRGKLKEESGIDLPRDVAQNRRSSRGEHIFNNALLKLYGKIVDLFFFNHVDKRDNRVALLCHNQNSRVSDAFQGNAPDGEHINLSAVQRRSISTWVVHFPDNVVYIPINNILFAHMSQVIQVSAVKYMHSYHLGEVDRNALHILSLSVEWMNEHRVYLDPQALQMWYAENINLIPEFNRTEVGVQLMLSHLDPNGFTLLRDYVNDLRQAGANIY